MREKEIMVSEFHNTKNYNAHDDFQKWRQRCQHGFFINVKTGEDVMLHRTICSHYRDTEWSRKERNGWGDLTKNKNYVH